jgi:hypothetical protein
MMTEQLKDLMRAATDDAPFTPDLDLLLTTGRRQRRNRRLGVSFATAVAIAALAGGTAVAVNTTQRSGPEPAVTPSTTQPSLPVVGPGGSTGLCTDTNGETINGWNWPATVYVQDTFGISSAHRSPKSPTVLAFCTTEWGNGARLSVVPGGAVQGIVLRKSAAVGRGVVGPASVTTVFGVVPDGVKRVTVQTDDGYVGVAKVKGGLFVYRRVEHTAWPGPTPGAIVRFTHADGQESVAQR